MIVLMSVVKKFSQIESEDVYKLVRIQKIKLTSRVFSLDSLRDNNGKIMARANGGLDKISHRNLDPSIQEKFALCHRILSEELPYFAGVSPVARFNPNGTKGN